MMVSPKDPLYQETKLIVLQDLPMAWPFADLAAWAALEYRLRVLNGRLEILPHNAKIARLTVVLNTEDELTPFTTAGDFPKMVRRRFGEHLQSLLADRGDPRLDGKRLLVVFTCLERIARIEANERVPQRDRDRLKVRLNNPGLWHISVHYDGVTFFFQTDAQMLAAHNSSMLQYYAQEYARVIAPYDELGYLAKRGVNIYFDSRENFEKNYQGNWHYYYK